MRMHMRRFARLKITPAMAAGVTKRFWEMTDLVEMLEAWEESGRLAAYTDGSRLRLVMRGTGTPLRLRSGDPVDPRIHVLKSKSNQRRGWPGQARTSPAMTTKRIRTLFRWY
jgi:hypothetical protein